MPSAPRVLFVLADSHRLPFRSGSFERIVCFSILMFLEMETVAAEMRRILSTTGRCALVEPVAGNPVSALYRFISRRYAGIARWRRPAEIRAAFAGRFSIQEEESFYYFPPWTCLPRGPARSICRWIDRRLLGALPFLSTRPWVVRLELRVPSAPSTDDYWRGVHAATGDDLAAVCYPALPPSFNRLVDRLFRRPFEEAVAGIPPGRALELGCGRGRWLRRLAALGWKAWGVDIAPGSRASSLANVRALPVATGALDLVVAVTVLQHVEDPVRCAALDEVRRVLSPGGRFLLVELLDREGMTWQSHVMPRPASWWREELVRRGFVIEREIPVEHLPILVALERRAARRRPATPAIADRPAASSFARSVAWNLVAIVSAFIEPLARRLAPESATHRLFLCRKSG